MKKFIYEIHRIITEKSGPFEIDSETWIEARVKIMSQLEETPSEKLSIKLLCRNPFVGTDADPKNLPS
jgi:hypothetical protein